MVLGGRARVTAYNCIWGNIFCFPLPSTLNWGIFSFNCFVESVNIYLLNLTIFLPLSVRWWRAWLGCVNVCVCMCTLFKLGCVGSWVVSGRMYHFKAVCLTPVILKLLWPRDSFCSQNVLGAFKYFCSNGNVCQYFPC